MSRIVPAFAALILLSLAEIFPPFEEGSHPRTWTGAILSSAAATIVLPLLVVRWILRPFLRPPTSHRMPWTGRLRSARRFVSGLPLLGLFASVVLGAPALYSWWIPPHFVGATTALAFLPFLIGWCLAEREWWRLEGSRTPLAEGATRAMVRQMRPVFLILGASTVLRSFSDVGWLIPEVREWLMTHPAAGLGGTALLVSLMLFASPLLVGLIHRRRPLPEGPLLERFTETARAAGTPVGRVEVWETGPHPTLNACVTGALPGQRRVYFTDGLIEVLNEDELAGVFAHELAHSKLHHLWIYTGLVLALVGVTLGLEPWLVEWAAQSHWVSPTSGAIDVALLILVGGFFFVFFGNLSRHLESQADLFSADTTGSPAGIASALQRIGHLTGSLGRRPGWRHPSIPQRISTLMQCHVDPAARRRFDRRSRRFLLGWAIVLVVGAAGGTAALFEQVDRPEWVGKVERAQYKLHAVHERSRRPWIDPAWRTAEAEQARTLLVEALEDPDSARLHAVDGGFTPLERREIFRHLAFAYGLLRDPASRAAALHLADHYVLPNPR